MPQLLEHLPRKWDTYYEPFVGGGALLVELFNRRLLSRAVISDMNPELINLYEVVKQEPERLVESLSSMRLENNLQYYLEQRSEFNSLRRSGAAPAMRAALFLYLNRHSFNGLWRVNSSGDFNVPFGRYTNPSLPTTEHFRAFSTMLQDVEIRRLDFEKALHGVSPGDFVYFDPPYEPVSKTAHFTSYTQGGFTNADQVRLSTLCKNMSNRGVSFMVSNADVSGIASLYREFNSITVDARRSINSKADLRTGHREIIITNYEAGALARTDPVEQDSQKTLDQTPSPTTLPAGPEKNAFNEELS